MKNKQQLIEEFNQIPITLGQKVYVKRLGLDKEKIKLANIKSLSPLIVYV